jgi:hypothetical protein
MRLRTAFGTGLRLSLFPFLRLAADGCDYLLINFLSLFDEFLEKFDIHVKHLLSMLPPLRWVNLKIGLNVPRAASLG